MKFNSAENFYTGAKASNQNKKRLTKKFVAQRHFEFVSGSMHYNIV